MQTRSLQTLTRIAKVRSFAQAAGQLNMTLPAVSMQMKSLEQELGVSLFNRAFRPPKLTPLGHTIAGHAAMLLSAEDELLNVCSSSIPLLGHFSIGFVTTTSVRLLPGFLKNAAIQTPQAHFDFETGLSETLAEKVIQGQLDAAIITASGLPNPDLNYTILFEDPFVFAAHKSSGHEQLPTLIKNTPFLHFMPNTGIGKLIASHMNKITPKQSSGQRPASIVLDSVEAIMECVKQKIGFTLLPRPDIERYADNDVVMFDNTDIKLNRQLVLVTTQSGHMQAQIPALKNLLGLTPQTTP